jgi:hypothetical protein
MYCRHRSGGPIWVSKVSIPPAAPKVFKVHFDILNIKNKQEYTMFHRGTSMKNP